MPPCPKCGLPTTVDDGFYRCSRCALGFRFTEGGGFECSHSGDKPTNLIKDWPYFWATAKWSGVRPEDHPTEAMTIDLDLPQIDGTRRQNLLVDMYMRWRDAVEPNFDYRANFPMAIEVMRFVEYLLNGWDRLGPILTDLRA
jgi:hypothetical protein